jgi:hypothetical protein
MNRRTIASLALALGMSATSLATQADSCTALLGDLATYASTPQAGERRWIDFKMVMNKADMSWSQYTQGELTYHPPRHLGNFFLPATLDGVATQYFSDRGWDCSDVCGGAPSLLKNPFNPNATDQLRVTINLGIVQENVIFTLLSWGNASSMSNPLCDDSFMYGRVDDAMYVFSFKKQSAMIPR